ncbi:MAG: S8 family serine peptidase [Hydrogenobacter sp.]
MKKPRLILPSLSLALSLSVLNFLSVGCVQKQMKKETYRQDYVEGQVVVQFRSDVSPERANRILTAEGMKILKTITSMNVYLVELPPGLSVPEAIKKLKSYKEVDKAEPNYIRRFDS